MDDDGEKMNGSRIIVDTATRAKVDELLAQGGLPETLRLATFGDHRLLDFLPQPVNSALQDYDRIAELTLQCALGAMNGSYQCGQQVVARHLRTR